MNNKKYNLRALKVDSLSNNNNFFILYLENYFFHSFVMEIENIINEEDRFEKIEDRLEGIFTEYESKKYLLRYEKVEENKKSEKLIVYLLNLDLLEGNFIFDNITNNSKKILSLIPSFLLCREFEKNSNFFNFDISKKYIVISKYTRNILEDILFYEIPANLNPKDEEENIEAFEEAYSNIVNTYLDSIDDTYSVVFTGEKVNTDILMLKNKDYYNLEIKKFSINKAPNFLPDNLKNLYTYFYNNRKNLIFLLVLSCFMLISGIFLYYKLNETNNIFVDIQIKNSNIEDEITRLREKIVEIEKNKIFLENEVKKNKNSNFKLNFLLNFLSEVSSEIKIKTIERNKNSIISVVGISYTNEEIIKFLREIEESKIFELINYDYIVQINNSDIIEFKVEINYLF